MFTNQCYYVFGNAFCVLHFYCTHFGLKMCTVKMYILWLENMYSKNVVHKAHHQIHKNMDLSTQHLFILTFEISLDGIYGIFCIKLLIKPLGVKSKYH